VRSARVWARLWRPFLDENRGGCPLTPDVLGRGRPLISRVLGAAPGPFTVALSTRIRFACRPAAPAGNRPLLVGAQGGRAAGGDTTATRSSSGSPRWTSGKAELTCCVRVPGQGGSGRRLQEVGVTRVVMEATSDYRKGVFYLLEAHGFETWLVNARDARAPLRGGPRPTRWTRSGCASSPSGSCCGPVSCHHDRSGSCGT
jgi:hypothetical protein